LRRRTYFCCIDEIFTHKVGHAQCAGTEPNVEHEIYAKENKEGHKPKIIKDACVFISAHKNALIF
jgi:hypothetical protein